MQVEVEKRRASILDALASGSEQGASVEAAALENAISNIGRVREELRKHDPGLAEFTQPGVSSLGEIQRRLKSDEALLFIATSGEDIHTFVVTPQGISWNRGEAGAEEVERRIKHIRCAIDASVCETGEISTSTGPSFAYSDALSIYQFLIEPTLPVLGRARRLYVASSGPISSLPLHVLPTKEQTISGDPDPYLADRYAITVIPTVAALSGGIRAHDVAVTSRMRLVGYGAPNLGSGGEAGRGLAAVVWAHQRGNDKLLDPALLRTLPSRRPLRA